MVNNIAVIYRLKTVHESEELSTCNRGFLGNTTADYEKLYPTQVMSLLCFILCYFTLIVPYIKYKN